jgi:hypothetical protein
MLEGMSDYPPNLITCTHQQISSFKFQKILHSTNEWWNGLKKLDKEDENEVSPFFI